MKENEGFYRVFSHAYSILLLFFSNDEINEIVEEDAGMYR